MKVNKGKFKKGEKPEVGAAIADGLSNEMFKTIPEKGVGAVITTNDKGEITQILVKGGKKKAAGN